MTDMNYILGRGVLTSDDPRHGTLNAYRYHKCRCEPCKAANADVQYRRKYGMPKEGKEAMLAAQGGVCASCGVDDPGSAKGWHIDHNHSTGEVRAILCHGCNVALGLLGEDPERIQRLADYARSHSTPGF